MNTLAYRCRWGRFRLQPTLVSLLVTRHGSYRQVGLIAPSLREVQDRAYRREAGIPAVTRPVTHPTSASLRA